MTERRRDRCPMCHGDRVELVVAPGRFCCTACRVAGPGPADVLPEPGEQLGLDLYAKPTS